jgi:hypothetical protein
MFNSARYPKKYKINLKEYFKFISDGFKVTKGWIQLPSTERT